MNSHYQERKHRWAIHDGDTLVRLGVPWNISPLDASLYRTQAEARAALKLHRDDLPAGSQVVKVTVKYVIE